MKDSSDDELGMQAQQKIVAALDAGFDALELETEQRRQALHAATAKYPLIDLYDIVADWRGRFGANSLYDSTLLKPAQLNIDGSAPRYVHFKLKSVVLFLCEAAVTLSGSGGSAAVLIGLAAARLSPEFRNLYRTFEDKSAQVLYEMYVLTDNGRCGMQVEQAILCAAVNARLGGESQSLVSEAEFAAILGLLTEKKVFHESVLCSAVNARASGESQPLITRAEFAAILGLLTDMKVLEKIGSQLRWKNVVAPRMQ